MSSFEAVVDAVRDEGMSLRQQLAAQAAEQESPAVRDAKEAEDARRQENTNKLLEKIANDVAKKGERHLKSMSKSEREDYLDKLDRELGV